MGGSRAAAEQAIAAFLEALGHSVDSDPQLAQTPTRVADAYMNELLGGYAVDVVALLDSPSCGIPRADAGLVVLRDVRIHTICPHHLLPGLGVATVAYRPGTRVLGLGVLARLVDAFARRLALQEDIGRRVVDALLTHGGARGAYCRLDLHHTCLSCRGPRQTDTVVTTEQHGGDLAEPDAVRHLHQLLATASTGRP